MAPTLRTDDAQLVAFEALFPGLLEKIAAHVAARVAPAPAPHDGDWLTPKQAADLLGLKVNTLEIWRSKGRKGPRYHKLGRNSVRYRRSDVVAYVEANARTSTSGPVNARGTR